MGTRARETCVCSVCRSARNRQLCGSCAASIVEANLSAPRRKKALESSSQLQSRLEDALAAQEHAEKQEKTLEQAKERLRKARARLIEVNQQQSSVADQVRSLRHGLEARQMALKAQQSKLEDARKLISEAEKGQATDQNALSSILSGPLAVETRERLGMLMEILPLSTDQNLLQQNGSLRRVRGLRSIYICGCPLPPNPYEPLPSTNREKYNAGLGYVVLLLDVLASLLDIPLLTHLVYQCSTSGVFMQKSFWSDSNFSQRRKFKVHYKEQLNITSAASRPSTMSNPASTFSALKQRLHWDSGTRNSQPQTSANDLDDLRQAENFKAGVMQICRSIGMLGSISPVFMASQSPFANLLDFCWQIAMRPRTDNFGAMSVLAGSTLIPRPMESMIGVRTRDCDAEEVDGWDMIQRPFQTSSILRSQIGSAEVAHNLMMPPPPSDSEDIIKHWEKANFSTPHEGYLSPYLRQVNFGKHVLPLRQSAFKAADRFLQSFRGT